MKSPRPRKRARPLAARISLPCSCDECRTWLLGALTRYGEACARARLRTAAAEIRRALPMAQEDCADMLREMARLACGARR